MTGLLRDYFAYMLIFMIMLFTYTMYRYEAFAIDLTNVSFIHPYMWMIFGVMAIATLSVPFIHNRMALVIVVGVIGFLLALVFVVFAAVGDIMAHDDQLLARVA